MKNSEKIEVIKKKKWKIPKGQVYYSNSDSVTITGELEVAGTFIVGYQDNSDDMKTAREVMGIQPVIHPQSEKRSKWSPTLIDQIILYAFDRIIKTNSHILPGIAQIVWEKIQDLSDNDDFWTSTPANLRTMASGIESKFGF